MLEIIVFYVKARQCAKQTCDDVRKLSSKLGDFKMNAEEVASVAWTGEVSPAANAK